MLVTLAICTVAEACQVPVFRYALERWSPDPYELVIVHQGVLPQEQQSALRHLEESLVGPNGPIVNLRHETIDLSKETDQLDRWKKLHGDSKVASAHLFYPFEAFQKESKPIWNGTFSKENVNSILDSPTRRQIVEQILEGNSAVWLFLESGNKEEDDKLLKTLQGYAVTAAKEIKIPEGVIQKSALDDPNLLLGPSDAENILESSVPLKIDFSILRLSRKNPKEAVLLGMLLHLQDDLLDEEWANKPMVFPAFGKGRVLPPLIGTGINEENILGDCGYLCGPCSCQVKNQNPGMDLLVKADWWTSLEGSSVIEEKELPPLTGVEDLIAEADTKGDANATQDIAAQDSNGSDSSASVSGDNKTTEEGGSPSGNGVWLWALVIVAVLGVGTVILNKNRVK